MRNLFSEKYLIALVLIGLSACSSSTKFEDKNKETTSPKIENIKREIASESPLSMGCHQIIEEILYIKEQEDARKLQKKKVKN